MLYGERGSWKRRDLGLFWVFSATSAVGFFLLCLRAHRHQLNFVAFVKLFTHTQSISTVFPPLHFSGLKGLSPLGQCFLSLTLPSEPRFTAIFCL